MSVAGANTLAAAAVSLDVGVVVPEVLFSFSPQAANTLKLRMVDKAMTPAFLVFISFPPQE
ncbi:hypothetical protein D3C85_1465080 [compost metagenome]